jgi:predicted extracellular nuclease
MHYPNFKGLLGRSFLLTVVLTLLAINVATPRDATAALRPHTAFTSGNLVVERIGTGSAALSSAATAVFLDEYTTAGSPVQSLALPTADSLPNHALTNSGTAGSEGALELSANGQYLSMGGYDAVPGTASIASTTSAATARVVGLVDYNGVITTSTALTDAYSGNNIRGAISNDGTQFWTSGTGATTFGGVHYTILGSSTSTQLASDALNTRVPGIVNGQLYVGSGSGAFNGVNTIGTGLPTTSGQTTTRLSGIVGTSPYAFVFTDANTLYVADNSASATGGIQKWTQSAGTWSLAYTLISGTPVSGLTGKVSAGTVTLYATTTTLTSANTLITVTDTGSGATATVLATAAANTVFRGVAFAPTAPAPDPNITTQPASTSVSNGNTATLTVVGSGATTLSYQWYQGTSGDTSTPIAGATSASYTTPALSSTTSYWVRVTDTNGSADSNTATVTVNIDPVINIQPASTGILNGNTATLTVAASGATTLSYQWYQGTSGDTSTPIAGATSASYTTPALNATTSYWVRVTDTNGSADSNTATVTVTIDPNITTQPASTSIFSGNSTTLNVVVTGTTTLSYQWYQGTSGDTSTPIAGATSASYTTPALSSTTSYWVRVTDTNGSVNSNTATVTVAPQVHIHDIQGNTVTSPLVPTVHDNSVSYGNTVNSVPGIVTALRNNGFYYQDPNPDSDPATSEGIFVYTSSAPTISVGDSVVVTGTVEEYRSGCTSASCTSSSSAWSNLTVTEIGSSNANVTVLSSGNALPAPIVIGIGGITPPNVNIESGVSGNVESPNHVLAPTQNGLDFWESLEGMRIQINNAEVVGPTHLFGSATPADCQTVGNNCEIAIVPDKGADNVLTSPNGGVVVSANNFNPQRIILNNYLNPSAPSAIPNVSVGAQFQGSIIGVVDYTFANYKLFPTQALPAVTGGATRATLAIPAPNSKQINIATFNVENLAPSDPQSKFDNLAAIVVNNLKTPDIIAVEEIQDNSGATDDGVVAADQTYAKLITAISTAGGPTYSYRQIDPVNDQDGGQPGGNIRQGLLFRTDRGLSFVDRGAAGSTTANAVQNVSGKPELLYSPGRINPSDTAAWSASRKPLAAEFTFNGRTLFVIANHFISKGGDQPLFGRFQPPAQSSQTQRDVQATDVASFVQQITAIDPNAAIAVVGDLNDYQFSAPLTILNNAGLHDLITTLPANQQYTYDYEGNSEILDHIMVSTGIFQNSANQYQSVHVNSEFFDQSSDHEPGVAQLNLDTLPQAVNDSYNVTASTVFTTTAATGILANDTGANLTVITNSLASHGTLNVNADGSFSYTPNNGFIGTDTFTYTINSAAQLFKTNLPPLATIGGVKVTAGGYGSSLCPVPGSTDEYYGVTDRGPNVDGPSGTKVEPLPAFNPAIGKFKFVNGVANFEQYIPLTAADGTPYSGRVNSQNSTGETITDLNGNVLAPDPNGYDSEGLVALPDGTFWVSDEYGPFITHFDATGKQIARLSPFDNSLPAELQLRIPNKGMEGLTITPDGSMLVGMMQSALQQPDLSSLNAKKITTLRIVTYNLSTQALHEYLYLIDNPLTNGTAVSEITALSNTTFLVDERDGNFPPATYKKLYKIDISNATDIGPNSSVAGATYNGAGTANGRGLLIGGHTLEYLVKNQDTITSQDTLQNLGITPTTKSLYLDVTNVLTTLDPQGRIFSHDKVEGVAVLNGGSTIVLSNDSDFGIDGVTNSTPPFQLHAKVSPATGVQDDGEFLVINLNELPALTSTATVSLNVGVAGTTLNLVGAPNPAIVGQSVTFTATVTGNTPSGTVTFTNTTSNQVLGTATLVNGVATVTTSFGVVGTYGISASYSGDANNSTSSGTTSEVIQTTPPTTSSLNLAGAPNPANISQTVTFTATVTGNAPSGTVTFTNTTSNQVLGTATIANGVATITNSFSAAGTYSISASYSGDTFNTASSGTTSEVVQSSVTPTIYTYYLPYLANGSNSFTTFLAYQNNTSNVATITVQYFNTTGGSVATPSGTCTTLAGYAECTAPNAFAAGSEGTGIITSNQPLNVIVAEATPYGGSAYAVGEGANTSQIAPVIIGPGGLVDFFTQLRIFNGGSTTVTGTVQFYNGDGTLVAGATKNFTLNADTSIVYDQSTDTALTGIKFYGWAQITGSNGAKLVAQVLEQRPSVHFVALANTQKTSQNKLYAPAIFRDAYGSFNTGFNVANPSSSAISVSVIYYDLIGTRYVAPTFTLAPYALMGVYNGSTTSAIGLPAGGLPTTFAGAAIISSTGNGVAMVVNEYGVASSGSASGTYGPSALANNSVGLPVMANGGYGYTTGTTVFNSSAVTVTGTIQYYKVDGTTQGTPKSFTVGPYGSVGIYQGDPAQGLPAGSSAFYGTAVVTENGVGKDFIITTNAQSSAFFYSYTEPNS